MVKACGRAYADRRTRPKPRSSAWTVRSGDNFRTSSWAKAEDPPLSRGMKGKTWMVRLRRPREIPAGSVNARAGLYQMTERATDEDEAMTLRAGPSSPPSRRCSSLLLM
jgi:hypothetical protein